MEKLFFIKCSKCDFNNEFNQPYPYHAGFSDQGFLYNEDGNRTLIWSSFDPAYESIFGKVHPWMLTKEDRYRLEEVLNPDPSGGGRWLFDNPARCLNCKKPISGPIGQGNGCSIHYLKYSGSFDLDQNKQFNKMLRSK